VSGKLEVAAVAQTILFLMSLDLFMLFVIHACTNKTRGRTDDGFLDVLDVVGHQQTVTFGS
jgi:hypothetical protein